uniref:FYVE-type domain-containing protein n=1 Tax=Hyaloperonospora arabidopsidis (strain Emoy2) TaxID=559515 RepID=M4BX54_HYAAE
MEYHYAETSQKHFECSQFMYGYAVDAVVLKNIHTRESNKPHDYMGIKWTCLQPSSFGHKRDNCFLEYLTYTNDKLGRKVGVRVTLPVEINECPDLHHSLRIKRMKAQSVCIVRPAGSLADATQLFIMSRNDFAGLSPSAKNFKKFMRIYNDMSLIVDSKHILKQGIVGKAKWVANDERRACTRCQLPFNTATRRRSHCRLCGDVFCRHCVILRNVPREDGGMNKSRVFQLAKTHFCMTCVSSVRREGNDALQMLTSELVCASLTTRGGSADKSLSYDIKAPKSCKAMNTGNEESSSVRQEWWNDLVSYNGSESEWSETDSEDASKASFNASGLSRLASSLSSSQSSWTTSHSDNNTDNYVDHDHSMSFIATLDVIDDDVAILDEEPQNRKLQLRKELAKAQQMSTRQRRLSPKQEVTSRMSIDDLLEVTEVVDTTDMISISELRRQSCAQTAGSAFSAQTGHIEQKTLLSPSGLDICLSRDDPTTRFRTSRSISQCLAEQEELLRRILSASRGHLISGVGSKRKSSKPMKVDLSATMPPSIRLHQC